MSENSRRKPLSSLDINDRFDVSESEFLFYTARKQCDHPECQWCARQFFAWLKRRMGQMNVTRDHTPSFSEVAATSIIPPKE